MKKISKLITTLILCFAFVCIFAGCVDNTPSGDTLSPYDEIVKYDEKEMSEFIANYDDAYKLYNGIILIVLTSKATYDIDEYTPDDFSQIDAVSVKKIGKQILSIEVSDTSRENILRAVYILNLRSDIESAEPNGYYIPF